MTNSILERLAGLSLELPPAPAPVANYVPYMQNAGLLFVSGQISKTADGKSVTGKLGADLTVAQGQEAAQICALNILAQTQAALGSLEKIAQVIRIAGYVNATPDFSEHPQVINGASDLFAKVLGDAGRHTRAAIGVSSLPANCAVEIDGIIKIRD